VVRAAAPGHKHKSRSVRGPSDSVNEGGTRVAVDSVRVFWRTLGLGNEHVHSIPRFSTDVQPLPCRRSGQTRKGLHILNCAISADGVE